MRPLTYGHDVQQRVKHLLRALLAYTNHELEKCDRLQLQASWDTDNTTSHRLVVRTTLRKLEELTETSGNKLNKTQLTEVFKALKEFLKILEDNRTTKQGSADWHFTLTLWAKDTQKNLGEFDKEWGARRDAKTKQKKPTPKKYEVSPLQSNNIASNLPNWQDYCRKMLPTELSINPLLSGDGVVLTIEDIVPLELVERKQRPQQKEDFSPEHFQRQASTENETAVEHKKFLEQVLETGESLQNRDRKIAIIGEPGAGKTTLLQ